MYFTAGLRPNRFILIREFWFTKMESKIKKWFERWIKNFFWFLIHLDESFYFWFWFILICDSVWFYSFWFAIQFDFIHFDSSRITIHLRIKNQIESKIKGGWIVIHSFANHWLIRFRIKSESKWIANQAGPSPALQRTIYQKEYSKFNWVFLVSSTLLSSKT